MKQFGKQNLLGRLCLNSLLGVGLSMAALTTVQAGAIITNGTITLGVNQSGDLNAPGGPSNVGYTGLYFNLTGNEATAPGCLCEGWGVGILSTGVSGYANESLGTANLSLVSFTSDAATAVSVVNVLDSSNNSVLQVKQDYHLSATPNLYEVTVSITNTSGQNLAAGDLLYRRVMDWDIQPTPFNEYVTIGGVPVALGIANGNNVHRTDNNGFNSSDPLSFSSGGLQNQNFTDVGPRDHGALFDFEFEALANGATRQFNIYYGAAATETEADAARAAVGANLYSYGQASVDGGPSTGVPNTFIFGFGTTGGGVLEAPRTIPEPATLGLLGVGLAGLSVRRRRKITQ